MAARIPLTVNSSSLSLEELPSGIDLDITGSNLVSTSTTASLLNTGVTTLSIGGAATTLGLGASTGTTTVNNALAAATTLVTADPLPIIGGLTSSTTDDNLDKGIRFRWATGGVAKTGFFGFDDSDGKFKFIPDATITSNVVSGTLGNVAFGGIEGTTGSFSSTLSVTGNTTLTGDLAVNGGDITTTATGTATLFNTNATTLNIGGAATTVSIGAATGTLTINNANTVITGNLTVNGTTTTINSTTLNVDDILVELGAVATPTDATAAGGGIVLKGATDKSITWGATNGWTSTEEFNLATGKTYKINGTTVLNATTLGSGVTASSLTSVGTITTGTWSGSFGAVSGANLTNLTAGNLSGTIPSAVLGNSTVYVGTTAVALNRASANLALTGISSITLPGSTSGSVQIIPTAAAGTGTVLTLPATTGTVITSGDSGTVTNTMLAGSIANAKLANSTISGVALGSNLNTLTLNVSGTGLSGSTTYNGSAAATFTVTSNATNANTASTIVARDASGNFSAGTITATTFTETSDERLKSDIVPLTDALDIVKNLNGKAYVKDNRAMVGLIAQEVERILPQVVTTAEDEMGTKSVSYGNIVAVLIEAVKEQQKQIEELKSMLGK